MQKAPMFARPPAAALPAPEPAGINWPPLTHPAVAIGGAAALMLMAATVLIIVTGDPHAGAPKVVMTLEKARGGFATPALRQKLGPDGLPTLATLPPGQDIGMPGAADPLTAQIPAGPDAAPIDGQAVFTLPQGASLGAGPVGSAGLAADSPSRPVGPPLPAAPIAGLYAPGPNGPLPIVAKDGRTPFQAYARPFHDNGKPKIALIVGGLGLNATATKAAIDRLPPEITLSFVPYADGLQGWIDRARAAGHEVLLEIPMEALDSANNDAGPYTLMAAPKPGENNRKLDWLLSRGQGYFGVTNYLGGRFVNADGAMGAFAQTLKSRGLAFIDDGSATRKGQGGEPRASADAIVDDQLSSDAINRTLGALEAQATQKGQALGTGFAYPVTVLQLIHWAQGLAARGYQLAPASAITRK